MLTNVMMNIFIEQFHVNYLHYPFTVISLKERKQKDVSRDCISTISLQVLSLPVLKSSLLQEFGDSSKPLVKINIKFYDLKLVPFL